MNQMQCSFPKDWRSKLAQTGHFGANIQFNSQINIQLKALVDQENWNEIDHYFQLSTQKDGELFKFLSHFETFKQIEFIISVRDAQNPWEEDGIWHDDGSRKLAFSLSLTENIQNIEGGVLEIRKKNRNKNNEDKSYKIKPFAFGQIIIFATGTQGFEHKINKVTKAKRIIIAGWCQ